MIPIPDEGYFQPRVKPKHRCPMTKELQHVRKHIIPKLLKHPFALPFKYPVDAISEGIYPDYFMVISHPMDLYTVKARLDHGWYWNLNHCIADINLIWRNARLYNPPDHVLHEWAVTMKNFTYSLLKRLKQHAWSNEDKLNTVNLRNCETLLETILRDTKLSEPFKIISKPDNHMRTDIVDLDTIERNLKSGLYPNAEAFAMDFRKMISRTYRYRDEDDPIVEKAKQISHKFEYEYAQRILTEDDDISDKEQFFKEDTDEDLLKTMINKAKTIEDQLAKLIQDDKSAKCEPMDDSDNPLDISKAEFDARRILAKELVVKIAALDSEKLKEVISIVQHEEVDKKRAKSEEDDSKISTKVEDSRHFELNEEENEEYLTLDFGTMNYDTMLHLQQFVSTLDV